MSQHTLPEAFISKPIAGHSRYASNIPCWGNEGQIKWVVTLHDSEESAKLMILLFKSEPTK